MKIWITHPSATTNTRVGQRGRVGKIDACPPLRFQKCFGQQNNHGIALAFYPKNLPKKGFRQEKVPKYELSAEFKIIFAFSMKTLLYKVFRGDPAKYSKRDSFPNALFEGKMKTKFAPSVFCFPGGRGAETQTMKGAGERGIFFVFWLLPFQAVARFLCSNACVCACLKKRAETVSGLVVSLWNRLCCVVCILQKTNCFAVQI